MHRTSYLAVLCALYLCSCASTAPTASTPPEPGRAAASYGFLARQQDLFHNYFYVYDDKDSGGGHFVGSGWMGDFDRLPPHVAQGALDDACTDGPQDGDTCIRLAYRRVHGTDWAGIYWLAGHGSWNGPAYDLTRYIFPNEQVKLTFQIRGQDGGELGKFKVGGTPDDDVDTPKKIVAATTKWRREAIELSSVRPWHIRGGFCWVAEAFLNQGDCVLYLDEIRFEFGPRGTAARLSEPRFVRSYVPRQPGTPDRFFRNASYLYDDALMVLAWCARGTTDDLRRAGLVCDAIVYAQTHDPVGDGRLRNAYSCGDLADQLAGGVPRLPGWWDPDRKAWLQDRYVSGSDSGNMAWTVIALLTYWQAIDADTNSPYLRSAERASVWIHENGFSDVGPGGYAAGVESDAAQATDHRLTWKSTEHNIDLYVAFSRLSTALESEKWRLRANHARRFVEAMIDPDDGHLRTGTDTTGITIVESPQPLDVAPWALLATRDFERYEPAVRWAADHCAVTGAAKSSLLGYDFNTDRDAVWWEGTAQMQLAHHVLGDTWQASACLQQLRTNGRVPEEPGAMYATSKDGLTTGFVREWGPWVYWRRPHTGGATCWYIFAELGWNPFWAEPLQARPTRHR